MKYLLVFIILLLAPVYAQADNFAIPAPVTNPKEVADYPLTEAVLTKLEKIQQAINNLPDEPDAPGTGNDDRLTDMVKTIEGKPLLAKTIRDNKMEIRDYVLASMAITASFAASIADGDEDQIFDESQAVSKANLAFAKKYADRIRTLLGG